VVERSSAAVPDPGWRDTVNVPAGETITIRVVFHDFTGIAVYHCHILDHEDLGMMGVIEVQ
jgi:FtsP/CotA-like multicopper oxidase with cupredoxin domain